MCCHSLVRNWNNSFTIYNLFALISNVKTCWIHLKLTLINPNSSIKIWLTVFESALTSFEMHFILSYWFICNSSLIFGINSFFSGLPFPSLSKIECSLSENFFVLSWTELNEIDSLLYVSTIDIFFDHQIYALPEYKNLK